MSLFYAFVSFCFCLFFWIFSLINVLLVFLNNMKLWFFILFCRDNLCKKCGSSCMNIFAYLNSYRLSCLVVWSSRMDSGGLYFRKKYDRALLPGKMPENQFWLLVEISPLHSKKVIDALRDFLVLGYTRREACERHEVSQGYFSGALGRFQCTHQTVSSLIPFYIPEASIPDAG